MTDEVELELFDLVGEVCTVAPDVPLALGDLDQQAIHDGSLVAEEATGRLEVADLDRCQGHFSVPS